MPIFFQAVRATATTNATVDIWEHWASSTSTVAVSDTWTVWANSTIAGCTPAQYAEYEAGLHARAAEFRAQVASRARELLLGYLNEKQRADLAKENWFLVDGKSGTRYRIKRGDLVGNVEVLNADGSVRHRLCAHDRVQGTPLDDQLLTQKFYLEHYEQEFLSVANRH